VPPKQASESETYSISSYPKVELLSPIAPPDALAAASSSVELLSPIALHDALAAASYGFPAVCLAVSRSLIAPIDWGQSIYTPSGGVLRVSAVWLAGHGHL